VKKIRNQKLSAIFKKAEVNVLLEATLFLQTKGFQTHLGICVNAYVCALERTQEKDNRICVLRSAWFTRAQLLTGIAKNATGKACDECKPLGRIWTGLCPNARTQM